MGTAVVFVISLPDLLRRLRRAWAPPGAALSRAAPPTDATTRLRAELGPLLAAIAELQAVGQKERDRADAEAARITDAARGDADRIVREAESGAPAARADAVRRRHLEVSAEIDSALTDAGREVARIEATSASRLPELIGEVTACVLSYPWARP